MALLLVALLLSAVPLALSDCSLQEDALSKEEDCPAVKRDNPDSHQFFLLAHSHLAGEWRGCTDQILYIMELLNWSGWPCKHQNRIILGNEHPFTNTTDVLDVCRGGGTKRPDIAPDAYESVKDFRVMDCLTTTPKGAFPNCKYEGKMETGHVVFGCKNNRPWNFYAVIPKQ